MGNTRRRILEGLRQKILSDPGFPTTSNERNMRMLHEAEAFARYVKNVNQQLKRVATGISGLGVNVKGLLESPLPRPYVVAESGEVVPETTDMEIVGSGVQVERITTASHIMQARLHEEVHVPLQEWLSAYEKTKSLLYKVEGLKVELDSRKRTVLQLKEKVNNLKSRLDKGGKNIEASYNAAEKKLQHKEEKCANCSADYKNEEQKCSEALRSLLKDSSHLKDFLAQAYKVIQETSLEAYGGFVSTNQHTPQPYFPSHSIAQNAEVAQRTDGSVH